MKSKLTLAALVVPVGLAAYVTLHPGVAHAEPRLAGPGTTFQSAGTYTIDPMHTSIGFDIEHMGLSQIQGRFNKFAGTIQADPKNLDNSSVQFTIQVESVDTAVAPRDAHLRTADYFEVAKYPEITFKSTKIRRKGKGYVADGVLTAKGVSKSISIPFRHYGPLDDPRAGRRIGIVADPIQLDRVAFGIGNDQKLPNGSYALGKNVTVRLALEATAAK